MQKPGLKNYFTANSCLGCVVCYCCCGGGGGCSGDWPISLGSAVCRRRCDRKDAGRSAQAIALRTKQAPPSPSRATNNNSKLRASQSSLQPIRLTSQHPSPPTLPLQANPKLSHHLTPRALSPMLRVIPHPPRTMFNGTNNIPNGYTHPQNVATPYGRQAQQPEQTRLSPQAISNIYKSCTNLFLTRRLPEALAALQPVVNDPSASIRQCPRALRIKFWGIYLAILDAAAKMTVSEGKAIWGAKEWPELVAKIRSGAVWDDVNRQYGDEGRVDADVVATL